MTSGTEHAIRLLTEHWPVNLETVAQFMRDCAETSEVETYVAITEALIKVDERSAAALVNRLAKERIEEVQAKISAQREQLKGTT